MVRLRLSFLVGTLVALASLPASAGTIGGLASAWEDSTPALTLTDKPRPSRSVAAFVKRSVVDLRDLGVAPLAFSSKQWAEVGLGIVGIVAAYSLDAPLERAVDRVGRGGTSKRIANAVRPLGTTGGLALAAALWASGSWARNETMAATGEDSLEAAVLASGVIVPILKLATGRLRPEADRGSGAFLHGGRSFPSGEASEAFAIASAMSEHTQSHWLQSLEWGAATVVAWGRLRTEGHWGSDVVAGGLIGGTIGRWIATKHRTPAAAEGEAHLSVVPLDAPGFGLGLRWAG